MTWETVFGTANLLAMVMWAGLILLPRWPALLAAVLYAGVGLLCLAYSAGLIGILTAIGRTIIILNTEIKVSI